MVCFHLNFLEELSHMSPAVFFVSVCRWAPSVRAEAGPDGHQGPGASAGGGGPAALRECSQSSTGWQPGTPL